MAAIALVDVDAADLDAGVPLDVGDGAVQRVAVERIAVQRLGVQDELAALGLVDGDSRTVRGGLHPRYVGKLLHKLGFSHITARPRHPAQDERIVEAFKNVWPAPGSRLLADQSASTYAASRRRLRP